MMKFATRSKNHSLIFLNYMYSHIFTLLIAIVFFVIAYFGLYNILISNAIEKNYDNLKLSSYSAEQMFESINSVVSQAVINNDFLTINNLTSPLDNDDKILVFKNYNDTFHALYTISNAFDAYTIHFNNSGVLMSDGDLIVRSHASEIHTQLQESIYSVDWEVLNESYEERVYNFLPVGNYEHLITKSTNHQYLGVVYPSKQTSSSRATIYLFIEKQRLDNIFEQVDQNSYTLIVDKNNEILYSNRSIDSAFLADVSFEDGYEEINIDGEMHLISSTSSSVFDLRYITLTSKSTVLFQLEQIRFNLILALVILTVFLVVLSYVLTNFTLRPITSIFKKLDPQSNITKHSVKFANDKIDAIVSDNNSYKEKVLAHIPIIKSSLCERLILGNIVSAMALEEVLSSYNILLNLQHINLMLLTLKCDSASENQSTYNHARIIMCEYFDDIFGKDILFCEVDSNQVALIFTSETPINSKDFLSGKIEELRSNVLSNIGGNFEIYAVTSESYSNVTNSHIYYRNIKINSEHLIKKGIKFQVVKNNDSEFELFSYTIETETNLISRVSAGSPEKVLVNLSQIFTALSRNISPQDFNRGLFALRTTVNRTVKLLKTQYPDYDFMSSDVISAKLETITPTMLIKDIEKIYSDIFVSLATTVMNQTKTQTNDLIDNIKEYIKNNYQNSSLSQSLLASYFSISESHLSRCFKQLSGETYSEYLTNLRMSKASELLLDTNLPINDIADKVGYNSSQVFRRTFKQFYGVTPNEHRNNPQ